MDQMVRDLPAVRQIWVLSLDPWVGKIPWRRAQQPTPVFLPGESHGHRSLVGYSPWHWEFLVERILHHIWLLEAGN